MKTLEMIVLGVTVGVFTLVNTVEGAVTYTWAGGDADWFEADNWTPAGGPPTYGDTALIKTGEVDHPLKSADGTKGSKDVADAAAGVTWCLMQDSRASVDAKVFDPDDFKSSRPISPDPDDRPVTDTRRVGNQELSWSELRENVNSR